MTDGWGLLQGSVSLSRKGTSPVPALNVGGDPLSDDCVSPPPAPPPPAMDIVEFRHPAHLPPAHNPGSKIRIFAAGGMVRYS
eukprot:gene36553-28165_t